MGPSGETATERADPPEPVRPGPAGADPASAGPTSTERAGRERPRARPSRLRSMVAAASGPPLSRVWLLDLELCWYLIVAVAIVVGDVGRPSPPGTGRGLWSVMVVLSLLGALAALVRWWWPRATGATALTVIAVGLVVITVLPLGSLGPLRLMLSSAVVPVLLAAAVRRARPEVAVVIVVVTGVSAGVDVVRRGNTLTTDVARTLHGAIPSAPFTVATAALLVLVPVVVGILMRSTDAARRAETLARLRADERLQVARELHDMVANHVTGMIVTAQGAGLAADVPPATARALASIEGAGNEALASMHRMVGALRAIPAAAPDVPDRAPASVPLTGFDDPAAVATTPLAAVRAAIGDDARVRLHLGDGVADGTGHGDAGPDAVVAADVVTTVARIVTEALTNARRHMPDGSWVDVEVSVPTPSLLVLEITNDRGGTTTRVRSGGYGLVGLAERAAAVGGHLTAGPAGDHRWRVHAEIPC